jgi:hypothetical protein
MPALFAYAPPWMWATGCALLSLIYFLAWPRRKAEGLPRGPRRFAVRWFHGMVWVLLGVSLELHSVRDDYNLARTAAKALAVLALVAYVLFVYAAYGPRPAPPASGAGEDEGVTDPRAR